jgi:hypothetical protein
MPTDQHQCLPGSRAPAIKNLHRETLQVDVAKWNATFFGGDDARVHLQDCQGGGLRCGARCPGCSTHSLPQVMSAGRNLITVFSAVNTLSQLFSIASACVPDVGARWNGQERHPQPLLRIRYTTHVSANCFFSVLLFNHVGTARISSHAYQPSCVACVDG